MISLSAFDSSQPMFLSILTQAVDSTAGMVIAKWVIPIWTSLFVSFLQRCSLNPCQTFWIDCGDVLHSMGEQWYYCCFHSCKAATWSMHIWACTNHPLMIDLVAVQYTIVCLTLHLFSRWTLICFWFGMSMFCRWFWPYMFATSSWSNWNAL